MKIIFILKTAYFYIAICTFHKCYKYIQKNNSWYAYIVCYGSVTKSQVERRTILAAQNRRRNRLIHSLCVAYGRIETRTQKKQGVAKSSRFAIHVNLCVNLYMLYMCVFVCGFIAWRPSDAGTPLPQEYWRLCDNSGNVPSTVRTKYQWKPAWQLYNIYTYLKYILSNTLLDEHVDWLGYVCCKLAHIIQEYTQKHANRRTLGGGGASTSYKTLTSNLNQITLLQPPFSIISILLLDDVVAITVFIQSETTTEQYDRQCCRSYCGLKSKSIRGFMWFRIVFFLEI